MPTQVQWRGGNTTQNNNFTGAEREVSVNEDTHSLRVHDGTTAGGYELARADLSNAVGIVSITASGDVTADGFVKVGGSSTEFLKADGSVDSTVYLSSYTETDTLDSVTDRGNSTTNGISVGVVTASSFARVGGSSTEFLKADGSVDSSVYLTFESDTLDSVTDRGNVTSNNITVGIITASSFARVGGSSTQFLKADGSVDSNTYLTAETDTLSTITSRGNLTTNGISVGVITATNGNFSGIVTANSGFNIGISSAGTTITSGPIKTLNFVGAGNTFALNGTTIDISIQGGGGGESFWGRSTLGIHTLSNIGVGTTNPTSRLTVSGDALVTGIATVNSNLVVNGNTLFVDAANNRIGIQTASPSQPLQVGTGRSVVVVDSMGELGIGTANPIQPFQVGSRADLVTVGVATNVTVGLTTTIISGISTTGLSVGFEIRAIPSIIAAGTTISGIGSTTINLGTATLNGTQQTGVTLTFATRNDGNLVVISGIGSVGIGTTNPTSKLHVFGDINLDDGVTTFATTLQCITPTANRTVSIPDATGTLALVAGSSNQVTYNLAGIQTGSPNLLFDGNILTVSRASAGICSVTTAGAANLSPGQFHGTWFTGGTTTTTKPYVIIEPLGTTSTNWVTTGTGLGINAPSGFSGYLFDAQVASSRRIAIGSSGEVIPFNDILEQRNGTAAQALRIYNTFTTSVNNEFGRIGWQNNVLRIGTDRNGAGIGRTMHLQVSGTTVVAISTSRLVQFEGETSSFPALKRNGVQLETRLADDSAYAEHAASVFQAARAFTVATLPSPPVVGEIARVTNATSPSIGSTVTGGGTANALVWYNGSAWTVIGV